MLLLRVNFNLLPATAAELISPVQSNPAARFWKNVQPQKWKMNHRQNARAEPPFLEQSAPRPCRCLNGNELAPVPIWRVIYDQGKWWKQHHRPSPEGHDRFKSEFKFHGGNWVSAEELPEASITRKFGSELFRGWRQKKVLSLIFGGVLLYRDITQLFFPTSNSFSPDFLRYRRGTLKLATAWNSIDNLAAIGVSQLFHFSSLSS